MKIDPNHNYRKPVYAISLAAIMTTGLLAGCGPMVQGGMTVIEESESAPTTSVAEEAIEETVESENE